MLYKIQEKFFSWVLVKKDRPILGNWHVNFIVHLASVVRPKTYVELGLYQCELFNKIIPFADELIGVDMATEAGTFMKKTKKASFVNCSTDEYCKIASAKGLKIDMLFIDANHSYESVKNDFLGYFSMVSEGGIILLHDGYPKDIQHTGNGYCGDGYKAIDELTRSAIDYEMMTIPVHPGLTLARKRSKHVPW